MKKFLTVLGMVALLFGITFAGMPLTFVVDDVRFCAFSKRLSVRVDNRAVFEGGLCEFGALLLAHRQLDVETIEDFLHPFLNVHEVVFLYKKLKGSILK